MHPDPGEGEGPDPLEHQTVEGREERKEGGSNKKWQEEIVMERKRKWQNDDATLLYIDRE